jgi:hypothetical protein
VEVDSGALRETGGGRDGDVDWAVEWLEEIPEDSGRAVAQNRTLATSENRRHEAPVQTETEVAHRVDASINAVQSAVSRAF